MPPKTVELYYEDGKKDISYEEFCTKAFSFTGLQGHDLLPADMQDFKKLLSTVKAARHNDEYTKHTLTNLLNSLTVPANGMEM